MHLSLPNASLVIPSDLLYTLSTCFFFLLHYTLPILELQMKPDNEAAAVLFDLLAREPAERWHQSNRLLNLPSNGAGEQRYYIR